MNFELNGELQHVPEPLTEPLTVRSLLEKFDFTRRRVAVAINTEVVPSSTFAEVAIQEGDRVEVIQAVGGG